MPLQSVDLCTWRIALGGCARANLGDIEELQIVVRGKCDRLAASSTQVCPLHIDWRNHRRSATIPEKGDMNPCGARVDTFIADFSAIQVRCPNLATKDQQNQGNPIFLHPFHGFHPSFFRIAKSSIFWHLGEVEREQRKVQPQWSIRLPEWKPFARRFPPSQDAPKA